MYISNIHFTKNRVGYRSFRSVIPASSSFDFIETFHNWRLAPESNACKMQVHCPEKLPNHDYLIFENRQKKSRKWPFHKNIQVILPFEIDTWNFAPETAESSVSPQLSASPFVSVQSISLEIELKTFFRNRELLCHIACLCEQGFI